MKKDNENVITINKEYFDCFFRIMPDLFTKDKILNNEILVWVLKIAENPNYTLCTLVTTKFDIDCGNCEYGEYAKLQSFVCIHDYKIIDHLIVAYINGSDLEKGCSFFFYDKGIIHIKQFGDGEDGGGFYNYKKHQISPQGKFLRYYDTNGIFENDDEHGFVKNHTREGKWIETNRSTIYLEAEYQDGLPMDKWKFYKLEQDYDEEGYPIPSSRKKGELLYTETYKDGELVERKFVK